MKQKLGKLLLAALIATATIEMTGCTSKEEKLAAQLTECAEKYGLENVKVDVPELQNGYTDYIHVWSSNLKDLAWDDVFTMYEEMDRITGTDDVFFDEESDDGDISYSIWDTTHKIAEYVGSNMITYDGSWDNYSIENSTAHNQKVRTGLKKAVNDNLDDDIGEKKCGICGKPSTKRIGDEYYCDDHYQDAKDWYDEQDNADK